MLHLINEKYSVVVRLNNANSDCTLDNIVVSIVFYWNGQLVWTPALALYLCVGDRGLCPAGFIAHLCPGYTDISARRRYQFWERDLSPTFKRISDRICAASINLVNHKLIVISAYSVRPRRF